MPEQFWTMSLMEISDLMLSYKRRKDRELKQNLINGFAFAESTAELIGRYISNEIKPRQPWDFFPGLFEKEKQQYEAAEIQRQNEIARENRKAYAAELRRRREKGLA